MVRRPDRAGRRSPRPQNGGMGVPPLCVGQSILPRLGGADPSPSGEGPRRPAADLPSERLHALWAKIGDSKESRHPLLWHLLDVAAIAGALWDRYVSATARTRLQETLDVDADAARGWFCWLAAMHDIGKVSPYFQFQGGPWAEHAHDAGMPCLGNTRTHSHEVIGTTYLADTFQLAGADRETAWAWASAVNIDRGRAPDLAAIRLARQSILGSQGHPSDYLPVVGEVMDLVAAAVGATGRPRFDVTPSATLLNVLGGVVKAADWLGSNDALFRYWDKRVDVHTYWRAATARAESQTSRTSLHAWNVPAVMPSFGAQFMEPGREDEMVPRPMQAAVIDAVRDLPLGSLTMVEAQMGEGKTEAALGAAMEFAAKGATGLFFGLPTQATASKMHERVSEWLTRTGLSPRGAILDAGNWRTAATPMHLDEAEATAFTSPTSHDGDTAERRAVSTEPDRWFRGPHRPLLAKVGVGTVDQLLLSAQAVKYDIARWAGLEGRVVILDEVHAYDAFMQGLFATALQWLAALGCPVILLSATLPAQARAAFANAYRAGLTGRDTTPVPLPEVPYPGMVTVTAADTKVTSLPGRGQTLAVDHLTVPHGGDVADTIVDAAAARIGDSCEGVAAVICNSVRAALAVADALQVRFPDADVSLMHARFTAADRRRHETHALTVAGKSNRGPDGDRLARLRFVVGTQVMEQSLDADFDWIVTEVAPVDLVLQRAGRLHRWEGSTVRPAWGAEPVLTLVSPAPAFAGPESRGVAAGVAWLATTSRVYTVETPAVMLASWAALRTVSTLTFPQDIAALVAQVYDAQGAPDGVPDAVWDVAIDVERIRSREYHRAADERALEHPDAPAAWKNQQAARGEDNEDGGRGWFVSRLGEPLISVALAERHSDGTIRPVGRPEVCSLDPSNPMPWRQATIKVGDWLLNPKWGGAPALTVSPKEWKQGSLAGTLLLVLNDPGCPLVYHPERGLERPPEG